MPDRSESKKNPNHDRGEGISRYRSSESLQESIKRTMEHYTRSMDKLFAKDKSESAPFCTCGKPKEITVTITIRVLDNKSDSRGNNVNDEANEGVADSGDSDSEGADSEDVDSEGADSEDTDSDGTDSDGAQKN